MKRICERIIKQGITVDNSAMLYAAAIKYDAKVCVCVIRRHLSEYKDSIQRFKDSKNFIVRLKTLKTEFFFSHTYNDSNKNIGESYRAYSCQYIIKW